MELTTQHIGKSLKEWRQNKKEYGEKGITQEKLAAKIGVSQTTLSEWENGKKTPNLISILKISLEFDTPLSEIFPFEQKKIA